MFKTCLLRTTRVAAASALIEHVYADARRRGASRVYWTTHESNRKAMQLYDRIAARSPYIQYRKLLA